MSFAWFKKKPHIDDADLDGLPHIVTNLTGKRENGPNCWNATIAFFSTQDPEIRFVSEQEMTCWLHKNTIIDKYNLCATGSILVLWKGNELIHTAVYVSPGILWHKRGYAGHWEFVTERQVKAIYFEATKREVRTFKELT